MMDTSSLSAIRIASRNAGESRLLRNRKPKIGVHDMQSTLPASPRLGDKENKQLAAAKEEQSQGLRDWLAEVSHDAEEDESLLQSIGQRRRINADRPSLNNTTSSTTIDDEAHNSLVETTSRRRRRRKSYQEPQSVLPVTSVISPIPNQLNESSVFAKATAPTSTDVRDLVVLRTARKDERRSSALDSRADNDEWYSAKTPSQTSTGRRSSANVSQRDTMHPSLPSPIPPKEDESGFFLNPSLRADVAPYSSKQRQSSRLKSLEDDQLHELNALRRRVLELEQSRTSEMERFQQQISQDTQRETSFFEEKSVLQAKLETLEQELDASRQNEIRSRTQRAWAEERVVKLEATCSVLESRLDCSARRQVALESIVSDLQQHKSRSSVVEQPEHTLPLVNHVQNEQLEQLSKEVTHLRSKLAETEQMNARLHKEIIEANENRTQAEWARVAVDKRAQDLESRLEHSKIQNDALAKKVTESHQTVETMESDRAKIAQQERELRKEIQELKLKVVSHDERVVQSQTNHALKKLASAVASSRQDLEAIVSVMEAKLDSTVKLDLDAVLGWAAGCDDDKEPPEALLSRFLLLVDRIHSVKEKLIDLLASTSDEAARSTAKKSRTPASGTASVTARRLSMQTPRTPAILSAEKQAPQSTVNISGAAEQRCGVQ